MRLVSERHLDDGTRERDLVLDGVPGILWTPAPGPGPAPLVLLGHPGGLDRMRPRLTARALACTATGFAAATIELPGSGDRPPSADAERARADLRRALAAGRPVDEDVIDRLILPLADRAVPEWQATVDALLALPGLGGPVGYTGGIAGIAVRLVLAEPRIASAILFAGSVVPRTILEEARRVTIPLLVLLQWGDEGNDRQRSLDLFDALGSAEKTLHANMGGHTGVPRSASESAGRFLARHLRGDGDPAPAR